MKLKMLETYQEVGREPLPEGQVVNVDAPLGQWLVENRKAEIFIGEETPPHYGAQAEPEFRHDDEKYAEMAAESLKEETPDDEEESQEEPEENPIMTTGNKPKRSKRGKK